MDAKPYHHGDLKRALVEAGIAIMQEQGLQALTLRACASRAGVSHAAPKNHFPTLRSLVTAIAAEGFRRHAEAMREGLSPGSPPEAALLASGKGYVRFATQNPALFELMFSSHAVDYADPALRQHATSSFAVLREIAVGLDWDKAGTEDGQTKTEMMLWSFMHGYTQLLLSGMFAPFAPPGGQPYTAEEVFPAFRYGPRDPAALEAARSLGLPPATG